MALRLHYTKILEHNVQAFTFVVEEFSNVGESMFSKLFTFAGHRWRLQSGIKGGNLGVFLRWYGGGVQTQKVKCKISLVVTILNNADPSKSISVGSMDDEDEFPTSGFGVGWSKMMPVEDIEKPNSGFLEGNCLFMEVKCRMIQTKFEDKMVVNLASGNDSTTSSKFSLFDNEWSIIMYPRGENPQASTPQKDHVAIYLCRENPSVLRFNVTFTIYIPKVKEIKVTHHFHEAVPSTTFGVEKFIRTKDLRLLAKGGTVPVGVKIVSIEPYFFLGFDTKDWSPPENLGTSVALNDFPKCPLSFKAESLDQEKLDFKLQFDPDGSYKDMDDSAYYINILWSVMVFCFQDDEKTTILNSWESPGRSAFCYSGEDVTVNSPLLLNEAISPYSPFLDEEKLLSVRLVVHNANEVYDPLLIDADKGSIVKLRDINAQTKSSTDRFWADQISSVSSEKDQLISEQEETISNKDKELSDKDSAIQTLEDEIKDKEEYIHTVEDSIDGGEGKSPRLVNMKELIQKTKPEPEDLEKQNQVAEQLKQFLMINLPFSVSRISLVGNAGQGTTAKGVQEIDLAIFIQDFLETSSAVVFRCEDVDVVLIPTNDWEPYDGFKGLYQMAISQTEEEAQPYYILSACERQTEFIANQPEKCKDLIRAVRAWCNSIPWKNSECKPGQYLLALLVIAAYQIVQGDYISKTVVADKEIFLELAEMVNDENLEVFWNEFYLSSSYPRELFPIPFEFPVIQDPAIPTHNVATTGLQDWTQFKQEIINWVQMM
ncbi:hypothetical protein QZH41_001614 [Actinostola sp. cb2023]|nr:hypothetical protein QZH41_001614 [Actinostola sp. cb2023]